VWLVHKLARHRLYRYPPGQEPEGDQGREMRDVGGTLETKCGVADKLDAVVERIHVPKQLRHSDSPLSGKNVRQPGRAA